MIRSPFLFIALTAALVVTWASGFIGICFASEVATVPQMLFVRSFLAGLGLLPLALMTAPRITPRAVLEQGLYAFLGMLLYLGGFSVAIGQQVTTGLVAMLAFAPKRMQV